MTAATGNRYAERQPSEFVPYTGSSGYKYYKDTLIMKSSSGAVITPVGLTNPGVSNGYFLGVVNNKVDLSAGLGSSQAIIDVWKSGEFTFEANGTGASQHIGQIAYALDDQTVGVSCAAPCLPVGEIVGIPSTTKYRVRINNFVGLGIANRGVSWAAIQN